MNMRLYPKLALSGIRKNRSLYFPYIFTCVGMVMMFYIMHSLSYSPLLREMRGGGTLEFVLSLGKIVIAVFALIFLTYTNSFLVRRRNKEFGLYNVLGMDKYGIGHIIAWESLIISIIGLAGGIILGIAFSKFAELGLLNAIKADVDYRFTIAPEAVTFTLNIFAVIFFLLFVKSLIQVYRAKPLELMQSENTGEKPPKANWVLAGLGIILLGIAYYMAVSIQSPLTAMFIFFVAVILVIIATYMLFTAGSVAFCRALQKNKGYYYKKSHFVSVSSMVYRMKRNGAGLASICILSTMVLVMIFSTASLYIGVEDMLRTRYPMGTEIAVTVRNISDLKEDRISGIRRAYASVFDEFGVKPGQVREYSYGLFSGHVTDGVVDLDLDADIYESLKLDGMRQFAFISVDDYNNVRSSNISLEQGQAVIGTLRCKYDSDTLTIGSMKLDVVEMIDDFIEVSEATTAVVPSLMVIIPDYETLEPLTKLSDYDEFHMLTLKWYYGYDIDLPDEDIIALYQEQRNLLKDTFVNDGSGYSYYSGCLVAEKGDFYATFGGLFFLGIMLSIVFIFAAVLIIYYKQISEGYEDQSRFDIMQKVGMTKQDIKKSINSQVLTVFFAPLLFAGLHLAFAFPLVWKMLQLFNLQNLPLVIIVTIASFVVFGIFYGFVYKATAHSYYRIVTKLY